MIYQNLEQEFEVEKVICQLATHGLVLTVKSEKYVLSFNLLNSNKSDPEDMLSGVVQYMDGQWILYMHDQETCEIFREILDKTNSKYFCDYCCQ